MVGITKECILCGANFQTKSLKSATWERRCHECHGRIRQSAAERHVKKTQNNLESSLRREIESLALKVSNIDILIGAEVSNCLENMTGTEVYATIEKSNNIRIDNLETKVQETLLEQINKMNEENKKFQNKIQLQLVALNNKIIKIMKEMK